MSGNAKRLPWSRFVWSDWSRDVSLRNCSPAARGIWMDMLCAMDASTERGYLVLAGRAASPIEVANMIGVDRRTVQRVIAELEKNGVFSRDGRGAIFSRRMLRDQNAHDLAVATGTQGGNPKLLKNSDIGQIPVKAPVNLVEKAKNVQNGSVLASSGAASRQDCSNLYPNGGKSAQNGTDNPHNNNELNSSGLNPPVKLEKRREEREEREESKGSKQEARASPAPALRAVGLPPWIPVDAWEGYVGMRRSTRKPMTPRAVELLIARLDGFRARGVDIAEALNASTIANWTNVYETRGGASGNARTDGKIRMARMVSAYMHRGDVH